MIETADLLGTTLEGLYGEHRRAVTEKKLANKALEGASAELVNALRNQTDTFTDSSSEELDRHNAAYEVSDADEYKEFETERLADAEQRYDTNIEQSADHFQQNQSAYHEQAIAESLVAGVEVKQ